MFATLGQLRVAAAESSVVLGALAADSWCDLLLGLLHVASPRCRRLALRTRPRSAPLRARRRRAGTGERGSATADPFVLELIGAEVAEGHNAHDRSELLAHRRRVAGVVDASVALLRRLILAETWRETLLAALVGAIQAAPKVLRQGAPLRRCATSASERSLPSACWAATWQVELQEQVTSGQPGVAGDGGRRQRRATTLLIAADGSATAPGATEVVQVASSRVRCRPQVKLPPALLPHLSALLDGYAPIAAAADAPHASLACCCGHAPSAALLARRRRVGRASRLLRPGLGALVTTAVSPVPAGHANECSSCCVVASSARNARIAAHHRGRRFDNLEVARFDDGFNAEVKAPPPPPRSSQPSASGTLAGHSSRRHERCSMDAPRPRAPIVHRRRRRRRQGRAGLRTPGAPAAAAAATLRRRRRRRRHLHRLTAADHPAEPFVGGGARSIVTNVGNGDDAIHAEHAVARCVSQHNAEQAAGWLFEHDGAIRRSSRRRRAAEPQHRVTALGGWTARVAEAAGAAAEDVGVGLDGWRHELVRDAGAVGGTGFRGQGAAAPPVATPVEQQFQTLAVTRPTGDVGDAGPADHRS